MGEGGRKAVLGIGFEERAEAIDFGIALQEVRKVQGMENEGAAGGKAPAKKQEEVPVKRDFSLKEGETIHVDIGRKGKRKEGSMGGSEQAPFRIPSPPYVQKDGGGAGGIIPLLPPPPSAHHVKAEKRRSRQGIVPEPGSAADLGFDDGEFGEFQ